MRIKKNDKVKVITGKDRGKEGKVIQVFNSNNRVSVEGVNILTKHLRTNRQGQKGQKVEFPAPLSVSNVMLVCPKCSKPTRVKHDILEDKTKSRKCKKCNENI